MRPLKLLATASISALAVIALQAPGSTSSEAQAQAPARAPNIRMNIMPVTPGKAYWTDSNTNAGFVIGDTSVIVIDSSPNATTAVEMIKKIREITDKPIKYMIQTHSDCDHINGAMSFPRDLQIIAHENNDFEQRAILQLITVEVDGGHGFQSPEWLPNRIVNGNRLDTTIDGVKVSLIHSAPAHTSGDLAIYFPEHKLVFAGDLLMNNVEATPGNYNRTMWFKYEKGGSIEGWLKSVDDLLKLDANVFVPGHGFTAFDKAKIRDLRDNLAAERKRVQEMADAGRSLEEIKAAFRDHEAPPRGVRNPNAPPRESFPGGLDCPRGIQYQTFAWLEYHEWLKRKNSMNRQRPVQNR